jgi:CHAT domain-containing protein
LVLSEANSGRPETLLSTEQIGVLDLRAVELVVLSACQSALGHVRAGQGTTGLIDAFDRAGVGASVCALWEVDDEATVALMTSFYHELWSEQRPPAQALRSAQLRFVRGEESARGLTLSNPRYWAAFEVGGAARTPPAILQSR